jgi:hypothetical protein
MRYVVHRPDLGLRQLRRVRDFLPFGSDLFEQLLRTDLRGWRRLLGWGNVRDRVSPWTGGVPLVRPQRDLDVR